MRFRSLLFGFIALAAFAGDPQAFEANFYFGMKASNYYRDNSQGDNFFGQRGFFMVETQSTWSANTRPLALFGSIILEGKNQAAYTPSADSEVLGYSKSVVKETGNYSAEVGLRWAPFPQGDGGLARPVTRLYLVTSVTFRNVTQTEFNTSTGAVTNTWIDRSISSGKFGIQLRNDKPDTSYRGTFVEIAYLKDEFYTQAQSRFLVRGRLVSQTQIKGKLEGGFFLEGSINRSIGHPSIVEKDESSIIVGLNFTF
ncbi:hypothetical protein [Geothrix terrae]|uniref:hypothetical protein n=1 Tax=Geothrix terrae TaxID=2922720 RepID=UPI001FACEADC|nr:hypothetical protein [Geothrix terrae]